MVVSATETISPLRQCYITSPSNTINHKNYRDGEQTGGCQELRMLGVGAGVKGT